MKNAILYLLIFTSILGCSSEKSNSQNDDLVGKWKLTAFVNETSGTILTASDFENSNEITIDFKENNKFVGYTGINDFLGNYSIKSKEILIFDEFDRTLAADTDWGNLFFDKTRLNYNVSTGIYENTFKLSDSILQLYYSENEYMKFEKI